MALLVAAFARPFFAASAPRAAATGGAREVVILLDQSASMGYGDHWKHAQDAAHKIVAALGGDDAARSCCSAGTPRRTSARRRIATPRRRAIDAAKVSSDSTRFGPALKLAAAS